MSAETPIEVTVKLDFWDLYHSTSVPVRAGVRALWGWVLLATFVALFAWFARSNPANGNEWKDIIWYDKLIAAIFVMQIILIWGVRVVVAVRAARNNVIRAGYRYTFSNIGIHFESSVKTRDIPWTAVHSAIETKRAFSLRETPRVVLLIPHRCFSRESDKIALRTLLRANVSEVDLRAV